MGLVPKAKIGLFIILSLFASFNLPVRSAVNSPYYGLLGAQVQHTPENNFESGFNLRMTNSITTRNQNINLRVVLVSVGAATGEINFPYERNSYTVPFSISQINVRTLAPLWSGATGGVLVLGNIAANYSPYTLSIARVDTNSDRKGIALEGMTLLNSQYNALLVWIGDMNKPLYGFKIENKSSKYRLTGILTQYLLYDGESGWQSQELVKSIEWNYLLPNGTVRWLYASQKLPEDFCDIKELVYKNKLNKNLGIAFTWRDFSPEYRPQFSDRTVKFSTTGYPQRWNPISRYYGQNGIGIDLEGKVNTSSISLGTEFYTDKDHFRDLTMQPATVKLGKIAAEGTYYGLQSKLTFQYKEKKMINQLNTENTVTSNALWGSLSKQMAFRPAVITGRLNYWFDNGTEFEDSNGQIIGTISEKGAQLFVNYRLRRGILSGITLVTGLKAISNQIGATKLFKTVGLDYTTRSGIQIHARFTMPNFEEPSSYRENPSPLRRRYLVDQYDRFGQKVELDNIFRISYTLSF